jgi:glycerol-3-phosphate acyltransferase PlsX
MKMYEGFSESLISSLGARLEQSGANCRTEWNRVFQGFQESYAYQQVGGAPLLGVKKPVVVAHGRSENLAISSAIQLASRFAQEETCRKMSEFEHDGALADFKYFSAMLILEDFKKKWGFTPKQG